MPDSSFINVTGKPETKNRGKQVRMAWPCSCGSKVLNAVSHLVSSVACAKQKQRLNERSNAVLILVAVGDPGMRHAGCGVLEKMAVVSQDHATLSQCKRHVLKIVCRKKSRL